jgi:hypothetical protein
MPRDLARIGLPSADDRVDIERIELDTVARAAVALRGNERGAAAEKRIEHKIAAARAIEDLRLDDNKFALGAPMSRVGSTRAPCRGIGIAKICRKWQSQRQQVRHPVDVG